MTDTIPNLNAAWAQALEGNGSVVWLRSHVGTGKSVMLSRFFQSLDDLSQESAVVFCRCGDTSIVSTSDHGELEALIAQIAEGVRAFGSVEDPHKAADEVNWCLPSLDFLSTSIQLSEVTRSIDGELNNRVESHLGVLFDIARLRPICLILDDVQRSDPFSRKLLEAIADRLPESPGVQLLLIASDTIPLRSPTSTQAKTPGLDAQSVFKRTQEDVIEFIDDRLSPFGKPSPQYQAELLSACGHNFLVAKAPIKFSEHHHALKPTTDGVCEDPHLKDYPQYSRLCELAQGYLPNLPANLEADLEQTSVYGCEIQPDIMAELWSVSLPAAQLRLDALVNTGMVFRENQLLRFLNEELAAQFRDQVSDDERARLHRKFAQILRGRARSTLTQSDLFPHFIDVTDTWRDSRKRDQVSKQEFDLLWKAAHHFAKGNRATLAAEAACNLATQAACILAAQAACNLAAEVACNLATKAACSLADAN